MSAHSNASPVIIKRKKVVMAGGHHGGAWKVAYADFVTAMMAFFLLMWLLNATTEKQRKGLADYFSPNVPISRVAGGGDGHFKGESLAAEDTLAKNGLGATSQRATESRMARGESGVSQSQDEGLEALQTKIDSILRGTNGESVVSRELQRHIITRVTDEGLVIELFDLEGATLFEDGTAHPTDVLRQLAALMSEMGALVRNPIAVEGHMRAAPVVLKNNPVWDVSTARAQTMRQLMTREGMPAARFARVTGHADRDPATRDPMAVRNDRLEVIFLRDG